jgi:hypothetical protein
MSKMTLFATFVGVLAGAVGIAGYHKAASLQEELRRPKAPLVDGSGDQALAGEVRRLEARVALLEQRDRSAPHEVTAPSAPSPSSVPAPPSTDPSAPRETGGSAYVLGPVPKDPKERDARMQRVVTTITAYWKDWGAKYGLNQGQIDALASLQADAARRKVDNQARLIDQELTQAQSRADNQAVTEEVRRKAREMLTPQQFAQFEADKGAEYGSSYRKVREAAAAAH